MDPAPVDQVVLVRPVPCKDAEDADAVLHHMLDAERAPRPGWTISMRVMTGAASSSAGAYLHAEGEIADESHAPVAKRTFDSAGECKALASAVGIWAQLVLDSEVRRAAEISAAAAPPVTPTATAPSSVPSDTTGTERQSGGPIIRRLELGAGGFAMDGTGAGVLVGGELFLVIGSKEGFYVRPTVAFGKSVDPTDFDGWFGSLRIDGCGHVLGARGADGMPTEGLHFDLCGGGEIGGHAYSTRLAGVPSQTRVVIALGPSASLHYDVRGVVFELRLEGGLNVDSFLENSSIAPVQQWPVLVRTVLGFAWRFE